MRTTILFLIFLTGFVIICPCAPASGPVAVEGSRGPDGLPSAPWNLSLRDRGSTITLSWYAPDTFEVEEIGFYNVYRRVDSGKWKKIDTFDVRVCVDDLWDNDFDGMTDEANETPVCMGYIDHDISSGNKYSYRVSALNVNGEGPVSESVSISFGEKDTIPGFEGAVLLLATLGLAVLGRKKLAAV